MGIDDRDTVQLDEIKIRKDRRKKSLKTVLNRGKLNSAEMDEMFLEY